MKIDVVIPNYNGLDLVKKNLPSVLRECERYKIGNVIITDDYSDPDEVRRLDEYLKSLKDTHGVNVRLLKSERNLGFSSNVNRGVRKSAADYVVLLNTDVVPQKNFLDQALVSLFDKENLLGVGLMDKSIEGDSTVLRGRGIGFWKRGFVAHRRGEVDSSDTFWISGGSSVIRKEIFEKMGGFDPLYNPFYWEDIDLSYRARKSGYDILFDNKGVVEHRHNEGAIKKHYKKSQVNTVAYRNQFIFVWKNITDPLLLSSHIIWLPYHIVRALINGDLAFIKGFLLALIKLPRIVKRRSIQAKSYTKSDRELL